MFCSRLTRLSRWSWWTPLRFAGRCRADDQLL